MKMIVGLGNPGQKYAETRHNIGFGVLGRISQQNNAPPPKGKFEAEFSEITVGGEKVILLCPLTYMNLSGQSVVQAARFFRIQPSDFLVICDDFNLPLERLRFRPSGSSGGQNGLNDIIQRCGTNEFPRLRIGIGPVPERWNPADFVLGKFSTTEKAQVDSVLSRSAQAAEDWVRQGVRYCMNQYNPDPLVKKNAVDKNAVKEKQDENSGRSPSSFSTGTSLSGSSSGGENSTGDRNEERRNSNQEISPDSGDR